MKLSLCIFLLLLLGFAPQDSAKADDTTATSANKPNVILIICDDLNDYVEGFGGHPQTKTPNIARLSQTGVTFTQAHCNIPICGPSRASFFTGIYPHHSGCYGFDRWDKFDVLKNSRTLMDHFRANGYHTLGTGKLMHHLVRNQWVDYGNPADYGPFPIQGKNRIAHPDVPAPFRNIGPIDGSFGPLINFANRKPPEGQPNGDQFSWQTGNWKTLKPLRVDSQDDRDLTADERNGQWAVKQLADLEVAKLKDPNSKPFFMGVGFIRPHTPLIVPQKYFDLFPLESVELPLIKKGDRDDTFAHTVRGNPKQKEPDSERVNDMGSRLHDNLIASYETREEGLKRFIQAYLASVASVDDQIGKIVDFVNDSSLADNTIIIVTSDHGWGNGEKDYVYKNSLWQESTRIPLIIRAPGIGQAGQVAKQPVSLIDIYPTLVDLCGLTGDTKKNDKGHNLDGHSMRPFLENPTDGKWDGPASALTALYKWSKHHDPAEQSYSLRTQDWRYIRYSNGKEELYNCVEDDHEWNNLAENPAYADRLKSFRQQMAKRLPNPETPPPVPAPKKDAEHWKNQFFKKHPEADTNKDGKLSWPEHKAHKEKLKVLKKD